MTRKIIGYYNNTQVVSDSDQLILEIGNEQVACMVKGAASQQLEGFEVFAINKEANDWSDILNELWSASQILGRSYHHTHCYYNFEEALIIPRQKFNVAAAEDYLSLVYGESDLHDIKYDGLLATDTMVTAYRIRKSLHELVGRHFVLYQPQHTYSGILNKVLTRNGLPKHFIRIQFYSHHIILAFIKDNTLQLMQSFRYQLTDDILYHVLNIVQQFGIHNTDSLLEIGGILEMDSRLHQQFNKIFKEVCFDTINPSGELASALSAYPPHYFAPFYTLAV